MASSSSGQSSGFSQSTSDTYIPEYSESPILQEIANHARQMSDVVYNWGMDTYNKNQGRIDDLMRDALSYASPQRISADMGMAEAGVQQAGERGRLSAIRDLESYGIDPSSGRYAQLDSANRVMTAAAAAGAGNQQRISDQAAGNAMRNQAIAASLQNAAFGTQAGDSANRFLATGMSLKYPPLGRTTQSTSSNQSTNQSSSDSGGGGSKSSGEPKEKQQGAGKQPAAQKPEPGLDQPPQAPAKAAPAGKAPAKPGEQEEIPLPRKDPRKEEDENKGEELTEADKEPLLPPEDQPLTDADQEPLLPPDQEDLTASDQEPLEPPPDETVQAQPDDDLVGTPYPAGDVEQSDLPAIDTESIPVGYDPYSNNSQQTAFQDTQQIDPVTGQPIDQTGTEEAGDVTGSVYGLGDEGGWTGATPADYTTPDYGGDQTWSDIGQGTPFDQGEYIPEYGDQYGGDWGQIADDQYGDLGADQYADDQYGDVGTGDQYADQGDYYDEGNYQDQYADQGDYYDEGDYQDQYADYGDENYYDDAFGQDNTDYSQYADDQYDDTDYSADNTDYADNSDYTDNTDYEDAGNYEDNTDYSQYAADDTDYSQYADSGGEEGYARGGTVRRRQNMQRPGGPPRRPMTGYNGGGMMGGRQLDPPPTRPGRMQRPPQAPRPQRGQPMGQPGGPRPTPMIGGGGPQSPGDFISVNGMPPPTTGGMMRPQRMARGGMAGGGRPEPTQGGFVSRELSPSGGSQTDDVNARLNAGEFVIPKDVATWKGKEFFYKMIANARKMRSGGGNEKPQTGYGGGGGGGMQ